jgi:uncharacterized protein (DUF169 family)
MNIYNEFGRRIERQIRPKSYPLAVKMLESEKNIPNEAKRPVRDHGACMSTCQCFALSRLYGATVAQLFEDNWCPEPVIGFGLAEPPMYFLEGNNRYPDGVKSIEAGANWAREFPRFKAGRYIGVTSAPLTSASFEPDVAVIYCDSAQLLRLLLGAAYKDGRDIPTVLGGHAACVYSIVPAILSRSCQVAVPCRGDRGRAGTQDDEIIFSIPKNKIGEVVLGLEQAGTATVPTRFSMKPEYELSPSYAEMARLMGMKRADGSEVKGYSEEARRRALQYK